MSNNFLRDQYLNDQIMAEFGRWEVIVQGQSVGKTTVLAADFAELERRCLAWNSGTFVRRSNFEYSVARALTFGRPQMRSKTNLNLQQALADALQALPRPRIQNLVPTLASYCRVEHAP